MFSAMRTGEKRVIIGSTPKMGVGTNIQNKLVALHHADCPWRPADLDQRDGRILRQGNKNEEVEIFRYVTKDTFDAYLYQIVEQKQRFISQVMTSRSVSRSCEDIDEAVLSYAEIKALAMGDPRIREKMDLDIEINKLSVLKAAWTKQRYTLQDSILYSVPREIKATEEKLSAIRRDIQFRNENTLPENEFKIEFGNQTVTEKEKAGEFLMLFCSKAKQQGDKAIYIGQYKGFRLSLLYESAYDNMTLQVNGARQYNISLGGSASGNIQRIDNALYDMESKKQRYEKQLIQLNQDLETAKNEYEKPWRYDEEYKIKLVRQAELNIELDLNKHDEVIGDAPTEDETGSSPIKTNDIEPDQEEEDLEI
jgi:hypothetical protein